MEEKKINWLENVGRHIIAENPRYKCCSRHVAERLSALLLERLPADVGKSLLEMLPEHELADQPSTFAALHACAHSPGESSIGFTDFVDRARHATGCLREMDSPMDQRAAQRIAEVFLWSFAHPFPPGVKDRMARALPSELRYRMDLVFTPADDSKVA